MPEGIEGVQRDLGRLEAKLDALMATVSEQGNRSETSRSRLYDKIEKMEAEQADLDDRVTTIAATVARIEPLAVEFGQLKQRGLAVVGVAVLVWSLVGGAVMSGLGSAVAWAAKNFTQT